jgi:signal transduction histidine kinase
MSLAAYLRGKLPFLLVVLALAVINALLLALAFGVNAGFALLASGTLLAGGILAVLPEYLSKRRYYRELLDTLAQLDKKHLLAAVAEYPDFAEGQLLYELLRQTGKSMNDEIERLEADFLDYREYIEMWVHEVKTPIAGIKLLSENTNNRQLAAELDRIDLLVEQALYYARSNTVAEDYLIRRLSLEALVGGVLKANSQMLIARHIKVRREGLERTVLSDPKWLAFILRQLLDNAVKYGATTLKFSAREGEGATLLTLRDNGMGISEQDLPRVFDKGFTGENGRRLSKSTGLGLYICRKLCGKLGLAISAQSQPGAGTTIQISFPQRDPLG